MHSIPMILRRSSCWHWKENGKEMRETSRVVGFIFENLLAQLWKLREENARVCILWESVTIKVVLKELVWCSVFCRMLSTNFCMIHVFNLVFIHHEFLKENASRWSTVEQLSESWAINHQTRVEAVDQLDSWFSYDDKSSRQQNCVLRIQMHDEKKRID